jgi:hypothetical protein
MMLRRVALYSLCVAACGAAASWAQSAINVPERPERPVVVELFSSQNCGNCPKANANVALLAERSDVIAVTYPVGYWDYLGWDDTFAKPEFAERQKAYNRSLGHRGPYTPQIVYSGRLHGSGVDMRRIEEKFAVRDVTPYPASVSVSAGSVTVSGDFGGTARVTLVRYRPGLTRMTPGGGANEGKAMTYFNLATAIEPLGVWTGGEATFAAPRCASGCLVLVQEENAGGRIIGAASRS